MNLLFRPTVSYAARLKKNCYDWAASLRNGGVMRRVYDGFLIQVSARNGTAIADVIDLDGVLVAYTNENGYATAQKWVPGMKLVCAGNPTLAGTVDAMVVFGEPAQLEAITPSGYVGSVPWPGPVPEHHGPRACLPSFGSSWLVNACVTGDVCIVSRLGPGCASSGSALSILDLPLPADDNASSARLIGLPISDFGFSEAITNPSGESQQPIYSPAFATCVGRIGFVGVIGSVTGGGVGGGPPLPPQELSVLRFTLVTDPVSGELSVVTTPAYFFSEADAEPEDRSTEAPAFSILDHLPPLSPGDGTWVYTPTSGFNPDIPPDLVPFYTSRVARSLPWEISASVVPDVDHQETMCRPIAAQTEGGLTFVFGVRAERDAPPVVVNCVASENPLKTGVVDCPTDPVLREAMYHVHITDGGPSVERIHATSVSITEPASWDNQYVQYYPVDVCFSENGPAFICQKVATDSEVLYRSGEAWRYACPGFRMRQEDTGMSAILPSGEIVDASTPGRYPAGFHTFDGFTGGVHEKYDGDEGLRWNFGRRFYSTWDIRGAYETSSCGFACHYAPGLAVVVMGDADNYRERYQSMRLVVVRVATGAVVAESGPMLAMDTSLGGRNQQYVRWHVTCMEEGKVDDQGLLTHHAILLLTMSYRYAIGRVYVIKDLATVQQVCSADSFVDGPVYYLGTPLAPARVGRTTGRSFMSGKPAQ